MGKASNGVAMVCSLMGHIMVENCDYGLAQHYY